MYGSVSTFTWPLFPQWTQKYGTFIKTGPGTVTFRGKNNFFGAASGTQVATSDDRTHRLAFNANGDGPTVGVRGGFVLAEGKMVIEGIKERKGKNEAEKKESAPTKLTWRALIVQGIATSIDALSVGFTISEYNVLQAFASSLIIGVVTLVICLIGLVFGKKIGPKVSNVATIIGGAILIFIGIEIFVKGIFSL